MRPAGSVGAAAPCFGIRQRVSACRMAAPTIVFDLDGTLVDTAPDLIDTLNAVLARHDVPPVSFDGGAHDDRRGRQAAAAARARLEGHSPLGGGARRALRRVSQALCRAHRRPLAAVSRAHRRARRARAARLPPRRLHQQARMALAPAARRARARDALRRDLRAGHVRDAQAGPRHAAADHRARRRRHRVTP